MAKLKLFVVFLLWDFIITIGWFLGFLALSFFTGFGVAVNSSGTGLFFGAIVGFLLVLLFILIGLEVCKPLILNWALREEIQEKCKE